MMLFFNHLCSVRYQDIDNATTRVKRFGPGALMAKTDIEAAFRLVPISPLDWELLRFMVDDLHLFR